MESKHVQLKDKIAALKQQLKESKEARLKASRDLRNLKRRSSRLKRAAAGLTSDDLEDLLALRFIQKGSEKKADNPTGRGKKQKIKEVETVDAGPKGEDGEGEKNAAAAAGTPKGEDGEGAFASSSGGVV